MTPFDAEIARNKVTARIEEINMSLARTIQSTSGGVTSLITAVADIQQLIADAPDGTFNTEQADYPATKLTELSAEVDSLSVALKNAITAAAS